MKSPMTQALMIILAIVFAVALSLTVALLCISYLREDGHAPYPTPTPDTTLTTVDVYYPTDHFDTTAYPNLITTAPQCCWPFWKNAED